MRGISEHDKFLIRMHCDWLRRTGATERTIYQRRENLGRLAKRLPCPLIEATASLLDAWQAGLRVCTSSIATYTNHVRSFYRWAFETGYLPADPAARLPRPRVPARRARPIPDRELQLALVCAREPVRTWLILGAFMGLRAMEVAQIRREDLSVVAGRLVLAGMGKGNKPYKLPVPLHVEPSLRPFLAAGGSGPLWRHSDGRTVSARYVTTAVSDFFRGIGMPYTLHWCRHRFGTSFYRTTKDLLLTQDVMRHRSPNSTRLYVETTSAAATEAMDAVAAWLDDPEGGAAA